MATIKPTVTDISGDGSVKKFVYTPMVLSDVGEPIPFAQWADRTVQVLGTFGAGGSLRMEGSCNEGTTYAPLTDPQGNDINLTAAKLEAITEITELARPNVTAGDGTTSLTVIVIVRRQNPMRT